MRKLGTGFWITAVMCVALVAGVSINVAHEVKKAQERASKAVSHPPAVLPYQVTVFQAVPATVPYERDGKMHFFCNGKTGYLVMLYEDKIAIDREGCK